MRREGDTEPVRAIFPAREDEVTAAVTATEAIMTAGTIGMIAGMTAGTIVTTDGRIIANGMMIEGTVTATFATIRSPTARDGTTRPIALAGRGGSTGIAATTVAEADDFSLHHRRTVI
jgi:hypothetical protein